MKVLIVGSGGREHALAWKLSESNQIEKLFIAPGNAGTALESKCSNVDLHSIPELISFAKQEQIDLTIVGPEAYLVEGIADKFLAEGLSIFAPNKQASTLEGSKAFAKQFMQKYGVKTAKYARFDNINQAIEHTNIIEYPTVVKASGLAAGKGVVICKNQAEAVTALREIMHDKSFGEAGIEVVIEDFLEGFEVSILSFCDGKTIVPLLSAKDHKKIGEGETGLNTGGMGVVCPNPLFTDEHFQEFDTQILQPTLRGLQAEDIDFAGVIFFGLMITSSGVYLLEYNVRFGDPETQAVLPLLQSDLFDIIQATVKRQLHTVKLDWATGYSCCVVAVSEGYPQAYSKGKSIKVNAHQGQLFVAGATEQDGAWVTSGGRVLNMVGTASTLAQARNRAYEALGAVSFDGMVFRKDIGEIR